MLFVEEAAEVASVLTLCTLQLLDPVNVLDLEVTMDAAREEP